MSRVTALFVHSSDELYGSDRVLLQVLENVPAGTRLEVWLPDDLAYPARRLSRELLARGFVVKHVPLPVLRRAYLTPRRAPWLMWRTLRCWLLVARHRPALLYINTSACLLVAPIGWLLGARVVLHLHEIWSSFERRGLGWLLYFVHRVVAVSAAVRAAVPPRSQAKTRVVYNGFPAPDVTATRRSESPRMTFLVASRWNRWKGHDVLFEAWDRLDGDDRLVVLGGPPPVGSGYDVVSRVERSHRRASIDIVGEVDDVAAWLDRADCVVVPSTMPDPLPTIAIEAAAHARPVIASRCGGLPEIVRDGETGTLFTAGRADELAVALAAMTSDRAAAMGTAARRRFEECFAAANFDATIGALLRSWIG